MTFDLPPTSLYPGLNTHYQHQQYGTYYVLWFHSVYYIVIYTFTIWLFARYLRVTELAHRNRNNNFIWPSIISAHLYFLYCIITLIQRSRDREYTVMGYFLHSTFKTFHPGRVSLIISKLVKLCDELDTGELGQWPAQVSQSEKWKWFLLLVTRADSQQSGEAPAEKWTQWKDENCCLFSNLEFWWEGEASIRGSGHIAAVTVRVVRVTREPGLWGAGDQSDESVKVTWSNAANQRPAYLGMIPGSPGTLSRLARLARDLSRELRMSSLSSDSFLVMENNQMFYYDRIQMLK